MDAARYFSDEADQLMHEFPEPKDGMHYMQAIYLQRQAKEFRTFERLTKAESKIASRLDELASISSQKEHYRPTDYFTLTPYLVGGLRTASVCGVVCAAAGVFGASLPSIQDLISAIWQHAVSHTLHLSEIDPNSIPFIADTGGMAHRVLIGPRLDGVKASRVGKGRVGTDSLNFSPLFLD
jgi:hypothetical protein